MGNTTLPPRLITGGMRQVIGRRLNRVPPAARERLKLAAVIGRDLDLALLGAAAPQIVDWDDWLTICINRAIFDAHDGGWRFAHDKLREALLDSLAPDQRAQYHRASAEAIEAVYADHLDAFAAALAAHWREAGDSQRERRYTLIAGAQAYDNSAYAEAHSLYQRALEIRAYADADNPTVCEAEIHYQLGRVYYNLNQYDRVRDHQRASLALYQAARDRKGISDAINLLGEADMRQGLLEAAQTEFEQALELRQALNLTIDIGYCYMNLGVIQTEYNDWQGARDLFKRSLDYIEQGDDPRALARALNNYASVLDTLGDKQQARQLHYRALDIRQRERDLHGVCYSLVNLGALEFDLGNYDAARPLLEQALHLARQVADRLAIASTLSILGSLCLKLRDYAPARDYFQSALDLRRQIADRSGVIGSTRDLGDLARDLGDYAAALDSYQAALALSADFPMQTENTLVQIAHLLMAQGRQRAALKLFAFLRPRHDEVQPQIDRLEQHMQPHAFASALALGEALMLDTITDHLSRGDFDF